MPDILNKVPAFWQGVLGSILATILILIFGKLFGLFSNQIKASKKDRANKLEEIRSKILSQDSVLRVEGYFLVLFSILQYLFVANIFWVVSNALSFEIVFYSTSLITCLVFFYLGLRQIFTLYKILQKDTIFYRHSNSSDKLHIQFAEYGYGDKYFDVTTKLSEMIKEGTLEIVANNETFEDPNVGIGKHLNIVYSFQGKTQKRTINEHEKLSLP